MSMVSLHTMISELGDEADIAGYDVLDGYNPQNLQETAQAFDDLTKEYLSEYQRAGLQVERYQNIDAFAAQYLGSND